MKKNFILILSLILVSFCINAQKIIMESSIVKFNVGNLLFTKVNGTFSSIEGEVYLKESDIKNAFIDAKLLAQTLNTGNKKRDEHLKDDYYFDVENYPDIKFSSINISKRYNQFIANGELTIKGISKFVSLPFRAETIDEKTQRLIGKIEVKRKDFNLGAETSDMLISDKIVVEIDCLVLINKEIKEEKNADPVKNNVEKNVTGSIIEIEKTEQF